MDKTIPIIIPAYEPDERFIKLLGDLKNAALSPIIVVNDGSPKEYDYYFETAQSDYSVTLLKHDVNMGKGKALKTAFSYCIKKYEKMVGCITADSDGQHTTKAIINVREQLIKTPDTLILGARNFEGAEIPAKSQFGNNLTRKVFKFLYKRDIADTQTGLRAIPFDFMKTLLIVRGDRFEFETRMLIKAVEEGMKIEEISIETIYDSKENHSTHFRPIMDSIRIYKVFGFAFGKFIMSSLSSSFIDLVLFQVFCTLLKHGPVCVWGKGVQYVAIATIMARIISATYNYLMNYYFVFQSKKNHSKSALEYIILAIAQMSCSAVLTTGLFTLTGTSIELLIKIPVDVALFLVSYQIQKRLIY